jgi:hypothetical protein
LFVSKVREASVRRQILRRPNRDFHLMVSIVGQADFESTDVRRLLARRGFARLLAATTVGPASATALFRLGGLAVRHQH